MDEETNKKDAEKSIDDYQTISLLSNPPGKLSTKAQRLGKRESVRSKIAMNFIYGFFGFLLIVLIMNWYKGYTVSEFKEILVTVSGILSGPLGFIIGFYFKDVTEI